MARVGVVIPIMGNKRYALAAINSVNALQNSSKHSIYIYAVDNGSKDGTTEELIMLKNQYVIEKLEIHPEPIGVARAWNRGISLAIEDRMDYIVVINSDLLLHKDCVDEMIDFYEANPTLVLVTAEPANGLLAYDSHAKAVKPFEQYQAELDALPTHDKIVGGPDYACYLIEPRYMDLIGPFDENFIGAYYEDNDSHWRIVKAGFGAAGIHSAMTLHFSSRSIREGGYHNANFVRNEQYFRTKHQTISKDASRCPGWTSIMGTRHRVED